MDRVLELRVEITGFSSGDRAHLKAQVAVRYEALNLHYAEGTFSYPLTQSERDDLRWYLEEYWKWPYEGFAYRGAGVERLLPKLGQRLYQAAFAGEQAREVVRQWQGAAGDHQISIITTDPGALTLPWELLHDGQEFLAFQSNPPVAIVRSIAEEQPSTPAATFKKPLRVLMITARPTDTGEVDARTIVREVLDALKDQVQAGTITLEFLRPPTLAALESRLRETKRPVHILHFDGHGVFGKVPGDWQDIARGRLYFEDEDGKSAPVFGNTLAEMLHTADVQLAVLNACQSATIGENDVFGSVAIQMMQGRVNAVVAMSATVLAVGAAEYVRAFYRTVAAGGSVQAAHEQAQRMMHENPARHPLQQRQDETAQPITLYDWWLPNLYLGQPLSLQPVKAKLRRKLASSTTPGLNENLPDQAGYQFTGRSAEFLQIERSLLRERIVVISGFGGIGKTALAREVADWLTRTKMYDSTCFVSFEQGGDASVLLSALGNLMAINDGSYHAYDPPAALATLAPLLKKQRVLIIADNVESILPGGDAALDDAGRDQLWEVLTQLQSKGAGVLVTSRNAKLADRRFSPGTVADYRELKGLTLDDAYALARQVLTVNRIDPAHVPYTDLCDLLAQLDNHPLAIRLTLPALRGLPLATLQSDFASLLPKFQDDQATGSNRSLQASLDYSLQWLSKEQRGLLPRLAPFEGGALELNLLNVTEISHDEWNNLRQALEQAGLLVQENTFEGINMTFQHFHPLLTPFLRSLPGADDPALRDRYVTNYYQFAYYLSTREQGQSDKANKANQRQGEIMRAWARVEFPNLRRSLQLMDSGDVGLITALADILVRFLDYFGRWRERDALRRAVLKAIRPDGTQIDGALTWAVYWQEKSLGEQEIERGDWQAATRRFQMLLFAVEMHSRSLSRRKISEDRPLPSRSLARWHWRKRTLPGRSSSIRMPASSSTNWTKRR